MFHWISSVRLPNKKHILVSRCNLTRFPDAKVVPSTAARDVLPALAETYNNFGNPAVHKAENGPPSKAFQQFSDNRGIHLKHSPPYHPQANEAECFMKPLGKAVKIAIDSKQPVQEAVAGLLQQYRATPNAATGISPGNMMFRGGYNSNTPVQNHLQIRRFRKPSNRTRIINKNATKKTASQWRFIP